MTVKFNDPELNEIYLAYGNILQWNTDKLNQLSEDIKKIDSILSSKGSKNKVTLPLEYGCLAWIGENIMFSSSDLTRRLLECPKEIRIQCKPHLAKFFKMCIEKIGEI